MSSLTPVLAHSNTHRAQHLSSTGASAIDLCLVSEEILAIHLQGQPYVALARTPGEEEELIAGVCYSDGLVQGPEDFATLDFFPSGNRNQAEVQLSPRRYQEVLPLIRDRIALRQAATSAARPKDFPLGLKEVLRLVDVLCEHQKIRARTHATHGIALFDRDLELLAIKEDLGRHNAFDKAIGSLVLGARVQEARVAMLSSRVATELVVKALRLGLSMVVSVSRPTEGALALAKRGGLSLACLAQDGGCYVFS